MITVLVGSRTLQTQILIKKRMNYSTLPAHERFHIQSGAQYAVKTCYVEGQVSIHTPIQGNLHNCTLKNADQ